MVLTIPPSTVASTSLGYSNGQGQFPPGGAPSWTKVVIPKEAQGVGLTEAPRGSLGHWISIKDQKVDNYQVVAATIWNACPRDDKGNLGPIEQALVGTPVPDIKNPFNVVRVVRSFDP